MSKKTITGIVIGTVAVGLIGYDIWAYFQHDNSTISEWIWTASKSYPLVPFALGVVAGHLFWQT
jgi:hypothetical protein